mgnify:CR=1 FL=1
MQTNFWDRIILVCANHEGGDLPQMMPHAPASGNVSRILYGEQTNMFYSCPRYYPENRSEGEPCCRNHISIKEYEGMLSYLDGLISRIEAQGGSIDIVGEKWKSKQGTEYKVVRQTAEHIYVSCVNRKAVWR